MEPPLDTRRRDTTCAHVLLRLCTGMLKPECPADGIQVSCPTKLSFLPPPYLPPATGPKEEKKKGSLLAHHRSCEQDLAPFSVLR